MAERETIDISFSELAKKSGLNWALVKYYFGNKQGLLLAHLEQILGPSLAQLEGLVSMDLDPESKIKMHVKAIISIYFRYPYINRLIHHLFGDPASGQAVADSINRPLARSQRAIVEQGIAAGVVKDMDPMLFYHIVLGACDHIFFGKQILRIAFGIDAIDDKLRKTYTDSLLEILMNGMLVSKSN